MNYGYIYKTTNIINGKIYIGQKMGTFTSEYLGSGILVNRAIEIHGRKNFRLEVLAFATTREMLNGLEKKYIFEYRQVFGNEFIYNLTDGGEGGATWPKGKKHSEETKIKMRKTHAPLRCKRVRAHNIECKCPFCKGKRGELVAWNKGLTKDDVRVSKYANKLIGKNFSQEHKYNLSKAMTGRTPWNKGLRKKI